MGYPLLLCDMIHGMEMSSNGDKEQDHSQKEGHSAQPIVQQGKEKKLKNATQHLHQCQDGFDGRGIEA